MNGRPTKLKHSLIFQIACVVIPFFILMFAAVVYSMYSGSLKGFIKAQNANISNLLERESDWVDFAGTEILDYLESHPDTSEPDLPEEQKAEIVEYITGHTERDVVSWMKTQPEEVRQYVVYYTHYLINLTMKYDAEEKMFDRVFVIDINPPNDGFVFWDFSAEGNDRTLGDRLELDLSEHPVLEEMLETQSPDTVFEWTEDFIDEGSQYIGYKPIVINDRVRAVLGISFNWSELRTSLFGTVKISFIIGLTGMIAAIFIQFWLFSRKAISPLRRIKNGVRDYIETKDSEAVIAKMADIKERNEFGILSEDISDLAVAIDKYTGEITKLTGERERAAAEMDTAGAIQAGQLPNKFPAFPDRTDFDIYASMTPAKDVGGDFYDFFFVDEDHLALVIADVSGKGVPAALFMMMSRMMINDYTSFGLSPAEVLTRVNEKICRNNDKNMFVTVWLGILEISTGKVTAANAGHEYPMLRQPGGVFEKLKDKHGFVLGGMSGKTYTQYEFTLRKGGTLFVFTDGVTEARAPDRKMFREERLIESLNKSPDAPPKELLELVHRDVSEFVGDAPQSDDLTMLAVKLL